MAGSTDILSTKQKYELIRAQLATERSSFISHWKDLNDYILPRRGRFLISDVNKGERRNLKIIDSTATYAARSLSSGMQSGITSPARPWFRLTTPDPDLADQAAVKEWLHDCTLRMQTVFAKSNWYNATPTLYIDMGTFGTAAMIMEEDERDTIRCTVFPVGSYFIANDERGRVGLFLREFRMTVRQVVKRFGWSRDGAIDWSKLSTSVQSRWNSNQRETWLDVVHVIAPNDEHDPSKLESKYKAFASCYYEKAGEGDRLLEEKGYDEFPVMAPRWSVTGEDAYGTDCPGMTALGDIKQLQLGEKRGMQAIEKSINPPLIGPSGLRASRVSVIPGDVTYHDTREGNNGLRPIYDVTPQIQELEGKQQQVRARIKRAFYEDLFLMLAYTDEAQRGTQPVTAAEISVRQEEKLLALGPVLEQLNQDLLDPAIDRVFNIMLRRGLLPPVPTELEGMTLRVEYVSIMAQAQKAVGLAAIERFAGFVGSMAQEDPTVWDKADRDQLIDEYATMTGVAPRVVVSDEKVAEIRGQRAKAQAAEAQAEQIKNVSVGAKNLSQSNTTDKNALTDVLAGVAGGV